MLDPKVKLESIAVATPCYGPRRSNQDFGFTFSPNSASEPVTCHCKLPPRGVRVRPCEGRTDEASQVYGRADYWRAAEHEAGAKTGISRASTASRRRRCIIGGPNTAAWTSARPNG